MRGALVLIVLFFSGCSLSVFNEAPQPPMILEPLGDIAVVQEAESPPVTEPEGLDPAQVILDEPAFASENASPITMEVAQKFFDGSALTLRVHLKTLTEVDPREVAIEAVGLQQGSVVARDLRFLDEVVTAEHIPAGKRLVVTLTVANSDISEYQVRGMWGEDALAKRDSHSGEQAQVKLAKDVSGESEASQARASLGNEATATSQVDLQTTENVKDAEHQAELELSIVRVERQEIDCPNASCPQFVTLYGELKNTGSTAVTDVELAVGLFWKEGAKTPKLPAAFSELAANERAVTLPTHILLSGEKKRLRLNIDRAVPQIPGGTFVPHARVLAARDLGLVQ